MDRAPAAPVEVLVTIPFSEEVIAPLQEVSPRIRLNHIPARRLEDVPPEIWSRVEVLYTDRVLPPPNQVPNLRWVQFHYAGIDFAINSPLLRKPGLIATNLSGANATQTAEHVLTLMFALARRLPEIFALQQRSEWLRDRWERLMPIEMRDSTVAIIGYGSIGREIARLLYPFHATILGVKRNVMQPVDQDYTIPGHGDPAGDYFTRLYPVEALHSVLKNADFVLVVLPLTPQTRNLISAAEFAVMKPGAILVDVGRGGVVDHSALIQALQDKKLGGAGLDVFPEEPLPTTSPLWKMQNVIITPHIGGISRNYNQRAIDLFTANLQRYLAGESLLNVFDVERGY